MDTYTASRTIERTGHRSESRTDSRISAFQNEDELPGQSLLRDYEQRPFRNQVRSEVYAESQGRDNCAPCRTQAVPYVVPVEYDNAGYSNRAYRGQMDRNQIDAQYVDADYDRSIYRDSYRDRQFGGRSTHGARVNTSATQAYDAAYDNRAYSTQNQAGYNRSYYIDQGYDRGYRQDTAQPIVIIDRSPQEYERERERHRGPGLGHALLGLAGVAGSLAFSYYGRNGGFNFGHGGWGGYRGGFGNCSGYGGGWNNYQRYRDPYDYGWNNGWNNGYNNRWQQGSWNNNWNNYGHHNNGSWMYPLAGMAMTIPWMINRNRNCNSGWNSNWNNNGWNQQRGNWRSGWRCR